MLWSKREHVRAKAQAEKVREENAERLIWRSKQKPHYKELYKEVQTKAELPWS